MSERGVFAVDRGIFDHPTLTGEKFTKVQAFMWLIAEAAWKPHRRAVGSAVVDLKRGQAACSLRFMAGKWGWEEPRVRRFLARLKTDAMIDASTDAGVTVITICNYEIYQRVSLPSDAPTDAASDAAATQQRRKREDRENTEDPSLRSGSAKPAKARTKPKTRIEESTQPNERQCADASEHGLGGDDFRMQWRRFRDHHLREGSLFSDWPAAWRTWLNHPIRQREMQQGARASPPGPRVSGPTQHLIDKVHARQSGARHEPTLDLDAHPGRDARSPAGLSGGSDPARRSDEGPESGGAGPVYNFTPRRAYG